MRTGNRGFTLIEVLVVIAIIAVLVGLMTPAVQKVRETASRSNCTNNMRQTALAMLQFENARRALPRAVSSAGGGFGTWQVLILPYIEQEAMFHKYQNFEGKTFLPQYAEPPNDIVTTSRFAVLTCPTDTPNAPHKNVTCHNYAVNLGNTGLDWPTRDNYQVPEFNGVRFLGAPFTQRRGIKLAEITDGLSTTLLLSEVRQGQGTDLRGYSWCGLA